MTAENIPHELISRKAKGLTMIVVFVVFEQLHVPGPTQCFPDVITPKSQGPRDEYCFYPHFVVGKLKIGEMQMSLPNVRASSG